MLKLFRVTCFHNGVTRADTFENFVVAGNEVEAKRIVEEEIWSLSGMEIKSIKEIDMSKPQLLVSVNTEDME